MTDSITSTALHSSKLNMKTILSQNLTLNTILNKLLEVIYLRFREQNVKQVLDLFTFCLSDL